jgi:NAD(P)H-quinone oxidoreductase subunit H
LDFCDYFLTGVVEYKKLITQNPIFLERVEGMGIIGGELGLNWEIVEENNIINFHNINIL